MDEGDTTGKDDDVLKGGPVCMTKQLTISSTKLHGYEFWNKTLKKAKYVVAPMVDQSELPWRLLSRNYGAELTYTPMLHAAIFVRDARYRKQWLTVSKDDKPLIVQFCANDPAIFLAAAQMAAPFCDAVELNLGCPQGIAKRGRYGAFLQEEWDLIHRLVSTCHKELEVPIACKTRIFPDEEKTVQYAKMLQSAGCQLLTVHGRTIDQKGIHSGLASWGHIKAVKEAVSIPVVANGNIQYFADVQRCMEATGADGVMSAEGNLHNPALFCPDALPVWRMAEEYLALVEKNPCPFSCVRAHLFKLLHHALAKHVDTREQLSKAKNLKDMWNVALTIKQQCQEDEQQEQTDTSLPLPHWLCQPYVRPAPKTELIHLQGKRLLGSSVDRVPTKPLLESIADEVPKKKNKSEKKKQDSSSKKRSFDPCCICGNPKGLRCKFDRCKTCCRKRQESGDAPKCPAHGVRRPPENKETEGKGEVDTVAQAETCVEGTPASLSEVKAVATEADQVVAAEDESAVADKAVATENKSVSDKESLKEESEYS